MCATGLPIQGMYIGVICAYSSSLYPGKFTAGPSWRLYGELCCWWLARHGEGGEGETCNNEGFRDGLGFDADCLEALVANPTEEG